MRAHSIGLTLLLLSDGSVSAAESAARRPVPLEIEARARAFVPGELLRVVVRSPEPLAEIDGTFHGELLSLVGEEDPGSQGSGFRVWSAWTAIDLDWKPGAFAIEVRGRTVDGRALRGARSVRVGKKRFPEQKLEVAGEFVNPPKASQERIEEEHERLVALFAVRRALPPPSSPFLRPVQGEPTSVFGARRVFNGERRAPHPGLDLRAPPGTPVEASGPGIVVLATDLYYSGNTVILDHGGGLFTVYAHLSEFRVTEGENALAGQVVGLSGATGRVTGPHLHWGAKVGERIFDPTALLDPSLFR